MFAYCRDNPVCRVDISGTADVIAYNDGELLSNDDLDERAKGGGSGSIYNESYKSLQVGQSNSSNFSLNNPEAIHRGIGSGNLNGTQIYRYGFEGPEKLVPTANDVKTNTGLSFSTRYRSGSATTTIEAINSSGTLYAVQDGKYHVSIYPVGGTIESWYLAGANSIWTQSLIGLVSMS